MTASPVIEARALVKRFDRSARPVVAAWCHRRRDVA